MPIHERPELRDRVHVFRDRDHAGEVVAGMLGALRGSGARVMAIPAGGVPVGAAIARALELPLDVAVVSKITPPWNSEVGYGAVAFDGTVRLNDDLVAHLGLDEAEVRRGIEAMRAKVAGRARAWGGEADLAAGSRVVLVDDGLASGFTMRVAVEALRKAGAARLAIAVPTGSLRTVRALAPEVEELTCANLRSGWRFAVADAYRHWTDVDDAEVDRILARCREGTGGAGSG